MYHLHGTLKSLRGKFKDYSFEIKTSTVDTLCDVSN